MGIPIEAINSVVLGEGCSDLIEQIETAFALAQLDRSELDPGVLRIDGMSGRRYRHFINNLVRAMDDPAYLEVGSWAGSTMCSAINGNLIRAVAIDNWSQFGGPKALFLENLSRFRTPGAEVELIEIDFREVDYASLGEFNIFLFDGPHEHQDQYDGLKLALPCLGSSFIFIVDDWNWTQVRSGTLQALSDLNVRIIFQMEIRSSLDNSVPMPKRQFSDWHNGYFIAVVSK